jgi:hypothetical protein
MSDDKIDNEKVELNQTTSLIANTCQHLLASASDSMDDHM